MGTLADLGGRYCFNSRLLARLTEDFSEEDWGHRGDQLNAAHWVLAHITGARRGALRLMGQEAPRAEWEQATALGSDRDGFKSAPLVPELLGEFEALGSKIDGRLAELGPRGLSKTTDADLPDGSSTIGEGIFGLYMHECFHLGQLSLIRRMLGKPRFM